MYQRARFKELSLSKFARSDELVLSSIHTGVLTEEFISQFYFCCVALWKGSKADSNIKTSEERADLSKGNSTQQKSEHSIRRNIWSVVANIHSEHGHTLGASVQRGYDVFRSWICCFCVWQEQLVLGAQSNLGQSLHVLESYRSEDLETIPDQSCACLKFVLLSLRLIESKRPEAFMAKCAPYLGQLIPVHCGHNGWPSDTELKSYDIWLNSLNRSDV